MREAAAQQLLDDEQVHTAFRLGSCRKGDGAAGGAVAGAREQRDEVLHLAHLLPFTHGRRAANDARASKDRVFAATQQRRADRHAELAAVGRHVAERPGVEAAAEALKLANRRRAASLGVLHRRRRVQQRQRRAHEWRHGRARLWRRCVDQLGRKGHADVLHAAAAGQRAPRQALEGPRRTRSRCTAVTSSSPWRSGGARGQRCVGLGRLAARARARQRLRGELVAL